MRSLKIKHSSYQLNDPASNPTTFERLKKESRLEKPLLCARAELGNTFELSIQSEEEGALIGGVFMAMREEGRILGLHVWIAPPFRERGHAREVGKSLLKACFQEGVHRVETAHRCGDVPAARLVETLRFLPEGIQRAGLYQSGQWIDLAHYGLLALDAG